MINYPIIAQIANRTWCINEFGMDAMFLLEGDEKALLIDTGTGTFDLSSTVKSLTSKPIIVALTHGHVDHAGGINQFDEIYLHKDDFELAKSITIEDRQGYADMLIQMSNGVFDEVKCLEFNKRPCFISLTEGHNFDLGNRIVKTFETAGHTEGGLSFLDVEERIMISGDACNPNILLLDTKEKNTISEVLNTAEKLKGLQSEFDRHYNGHIGYAGYIAFQSLPSNLIQDTIDLCHDILDGEIIGEEIENPFGGTCLIAKNKTMQIQFKKENIK